MYYTCYKLQLRSEMSKEKHHYASALNPALQAKNTTQYQSQCYLRYFQLY